MGFSRTGDDADDDDDRTAGWRKMPVHEQHRAHGQSASQGRLAKGEDENSCWWLLLMLMLMQEEREGRLQVRCFLIVSTRTGLD